MLMLMQRLKLSQKLFVVPLILIGGTAIVIIISIVSLSKSSEAVTELYERRMTRALDVYDILMDFSEASSGLNKIIIWNRSKYDKAKINELTNSTFKKIDEALRQLAQLEASAQLYKGRYQKLIDVGNELKKNAQTIIDLAEYDLNAATMALSTIDEKYSAIHKELNELAENQRDNAKQKYFTTTEGINSTEFNILIIFGIVLVVSIYTTIKINKMILQPINETVKVIRNVSEGDFTQSVEVTTKDEIGEMAENVNAMIIKLRNVLEEVTVSSATIAGATTEISSSTEQMSAGAQEQTSQAGEVASAVEEMTKTIVENSKNALQTAETARKAKDTAEEGGQIVKETIEGMKRIADVVKRSAETVQALGKASDQIGEIISVIDDIADQTNLLALNAAIEAARAGEQGRGFAVVADEVRKLAERTTKATKEIATMIRQIQNETKGAVVSMAEGTQKVDEGIALADKAGIALVKIVQISQQVTDMVNQIAAASEQQSSASEQISKNIEAISTVTQQTASGIQQIARSAEDLNRLTEQLRELVGTFKLGTESEKELRARAVTTSKRQTTVLPQRTTRSVTHY